MLHTRNFLQINLIMFLFISISSLATTYYVSNSGDDLNDGLSWQNAFATIQYAVDNAANEDEIILAPGIYTSEGDNPVVWIYMKGVTIRSIEPENWDVVDSTIIDGENTRVGILTQDNVNMPTIYGVTVRNGSDRNISTSTNITIRNCKIVSGYKYGIGWYNSGAPSPNSNCIRIVENCKIYKNGIFGLYYFPNSTGKWYIKNNCIYNNASGIYGNNGSQSSFEGIVANNTIVNNLYYGINFYSTSAYPAVVENNIIWGDQQNYAFKNCTPHYCCVPENYLSQTTNSISVDPDFINPDNNDFRLSWQSPCINLGNPNGDYTGQVDIEGQSRLSETIDIGADEYHPVVNLTQDEYYLTIQDAIDGAINGDEIVIYDGIYTGTGNRDIDFLGKSITVRSANGPENCIIDCQSTAQDRHRGFNFHSGEDANSILDGITILHGRGLPVTVEFYGEQITWHMGNAIHCDASSPTIRNCILTENVDEDPESDGTISCVSGSSPTIENCNISNNSCEWAAGITCWIDSSPTIIDCQMNNNIATIGGVSCFTNSSPLIKGCDVSDNSIFLSGSHSSGTGGVICYDASSPVIENSTFTNNYADYGGALYYEQDCHPVMRNCLMSDNRVTRAGGAVNGYYGNAQFINCTVVNNVAEMYWGGGFQFGLGGNPVVSNCIIYGNSAPSGSQVFHVITHPSYSYCNIEGSGGSANWNVPGGIDGGGNIDSDPLFINPTSDYHIDPNSPCINAGDLAGDYTGQTDIDGESRVQAIPPAAFRIDIGADEYVQKRIQNITQEKWYGCIQIAINDSQDGDEIVLNTGVYYESIKLNGKKITVRSTNPNDWEIVSATIIDASEIDNVIKCVSGEDVSTIIQGLTVRNSGTVYGYRTGIYCLGSSPTIRNCIIDDNWCGVWCFYGAPLILNNIIKNSHDTGILVSDNKPVIRGNVVDGSGLDGIVVVYENNGKTIIENNTVVNHGRYGVLCLGEADPIIRNCILWNNGTEDVYQGSAAYSCIEDGDAGTGNISSNPLFVNAVNKNYHLQPTSPCIDSGDPNETAGDQFDIDNQPRLQGPMIDMGADESDPLIWTDCNEIEVIIYEGQTLTWPLTIGNNGGTNLNFKVWPGNNEVIESMDMMSTLMTKDDVTELPASNDEIILEYTFEEPVFTDSEGYNHVSLKGCYPYEITGAPVVPLKSARVLIPYGREIKKIEVKLLEKSILEGKYNLPPAQELYPVNYEGEQKKTEPDPAIYSSDQLWPKQEFESLPVQSKRGYQLQYVNLFPIQYQPKSGKVSFSSTIQLKIILESEKVDGKQAQKISKKKKSILKSTPDLKQKLTKQIDNPDAMASYSSATEESVSMETMQDDVSMMLSGPLEGGPYQYVIITSEELSNAPGPWNFQKLRDSKLARGISATIVTTEWIVANYDGTRPDGGEDDQTRIRNFLTEAYQNWDTEYVLLGGTPDHVPAREVCYLRADTGIEVPSDMYYACVDPIESFDEDADGVYGENHDGLEGGEIDFFAEVSVGRATVESFEEVANFVRKTLVYSTGGMSYQNIRDVSMVAEPWNSEYSGFMKYDIEPIRWGSSLPLGPENPDGTIGFANHQCEDMFSFDVSRNLYSAEMHWYEQDFFELCNDGVHIIQHCAHSSQASMGKINVWELNALENKDAFFIYSLGCSPGTFDFKYTYYDHLYGCVAEEITSMEKGAFGAIMNSGTNYVVGVARQFWDAIFDENLRNIGWAHYDSKEDMVYKIPSSFPTRHVILGRTLFGDPELQFQFGQYNPSAWCKVTSTEGMINAQDAINADVLLSAELLPSGQFENEILIYSNDLERPYQNIPVKMSVVAPGTVMAVLPYDDLKAVSEMNTPVPESQKYTLTNLESYSISWIVNGAQNWVDIWPDNGILQPGESVEVHVSLNELSHLLFGGVFSDTITFTNSTDSESFTRQVMLVTPYLTEEFSNEDVDLQYQSITFLPDSSQAQYVVCHTTATQFPVDPTGGTSLTFGGVQENYLFEEIALSGGKTVSLYGVNYDTVFVAGNGLLTFETDPSVRNGLLWPELESHFKSANISALYSYLAPWEGGTISYKQLSDRIVFTFENVPEWEMLDNLNSFQVELFFNGIIRITYLDINLYWQKEGFPYFIGLSEGLGVPDNFVEIDFSDFEKIGVENTTTHIPYLTIQDAIDEAINDDEIVVYPGIYHENINFSGKSITIRSMDPYQWETVDATIIDGKGASNTAQLGSGAQHPILSGFTVTGGTNGVYCMGSSNIDVNHCIITGNTGVGAWITSCNAYLTNCIIKDNTNQGVYVASASSNIKNTLIENNNTGVEIHIYASSNLQNCTIVNNNSYGVNKVEPLYAGATITNCVLWNNNDDLANCAATYSCIEDGDLGTGNIHDDPLFVDALGGDFHIDFDSPCIDTGNPSGNYTGQTDIDSDNRVIDGDGDQTAIVDIGADEYNLN